MSYELKSIRIDLQQYGEFKGKYVGKVEFSNKESEAFMFNLAPEKAQQFLQLISEQLVMSASKLGEDLLQSMNLLVDKKILEISNP